MPEGSKVRIAYLTGVYPRASDTFVRIEVQTLRSMGFDVHTFSIRRPDESLLVGEQVQSEARGTHYLLEGGLWRLLRAAVLTAMCRPLRFIKTLALMWRTGAPGLRGRFFHAAYFAEAAYLSRLLLSRRIRHLHNHIGENSATVAMLASQLSGIPFSLTIHGPGIFFHPRHWALGEKIERSAFTACISHFCLSQCMVVTSVSAWNRLRLVHCAFDPMFSSVPLTPVPRELHFLFVGRLCQEKGISLLVEAIKRLRSRHSGITLSIIGDGPLRSDLHKSIINAGLEHQIKLFGWQTSEFIRQAMIDSRALVLPSFAEGLPVVFMEAFAVQRPVIATRIAGIPELVEHGISGWLIEPGSVEALVEAMHQVCETSCDLLARMGQAGFQRVIRQHDARTEVTKLASCMLESLEERRVKSVAVQSPAEWLAEGSISKVMDPCI
jgi:glycosyltransferase involved in cell wall biosynthesis